MLLGSILLLACTQDAIFYTIQYDKELNKDAAIPGSPGKIVKLGEVLYVGTNAVYQYDPDGEARWRRMQDQPGKKMIMDLAGTDDGYLYALVMEGVDLSDAGLYRKKTNGSATPWEVIPKPGGSIQGLWGAGDALFAAVQDGKENSVLYVMGRGESSFSLVEGVSGMLRAAAKVGTKYYAAIWDKGLLVADDPKALGTKDPLSDGDDTPDNFVGLVKIDDSLIAVSSSGLIWRIDKSGDIESKKFDISLNGAVAKWRNPEKDEKDTTPDLLVLGRTVPGGSSTITYYYGYSELPITFSGETPVLGDKLQNPGEPVSPYSSTVSMYDTYYNTLGTHPVISFYQAQDSVLFAATQKTGLWSCRQTDEKWEWNIE
jgi:hypothetical protein